MNPEQINDWEREILEAAFWQGKLTASEVKEHFFPIISQVIKQAKAEELARVMGVIDAAKDMVGPIVSEHDKGEVSGYNMLKVVLVEGKEVQHIGEEKSTKTAPNTLNGAAPDISVPASIDKIITEFISNAHAYQETQDFDMDRQTDARRMDLCAR